MTAGISAANLASPWLNTMRGGGNGVDYAAPAQLWVQLHVGNPGAAGASNVAAGSTARRQATLSESISGSPLGLTGSSPAWTNGGTSEEVSYISVWTAASGGTFKFSALLSTPQAWAAGNTFTLITLYMALLPQAA